MSRILLSIWFNLNSYPTTWYVLGECTSWGDGWMTSHGRRVIDAWIHSKEGDSLLVIQPDRAHFTHTHTYTHIHICACRIYIYTYIYTNTHGNMHTSTHKYIAWIHSKEGDSLLVIQSCNLTHILHNASTHIHTHSYLLTFTYTHAHSHTHTHTHMHTCYIYAYRYCRPVNILLTWRQPACSPVFPVVLKAFFTNKPTHFTIHIHPPIISKTLGYANLQACVYLFNKEKCRGKTKIIFQKTAIILLMKWCTLCPPVQTQNFHICRILCCKMSAASLSPLARKMLKFQNIFVQIAKCIW